MDTCQFTFISKSDIIRTAIGVEQAWEVLCERLNRTGPGLHGGTHYFTISSEGPELFAVVENDNGFHVYYHDEGKWHRYITARDIIFGTMPDTTVNGLLTRAPNTI